MQNYWWILPGPSKFVENIIDDIRDGKNVVLLLPEFFPKNLENNIRLEFERNFHWHSLELDHKDFIDPLQFLYTHFVHDHDSNKFRNVQNLIQSDSFSGHVFWLRSIDEQQWKVWKGFIDKYQHACRSIPRPSRTVFCVSLEGNLSRSSMNEDVCLSVRKWDGYVDDLDLLVYSSKLLESFRGSSLQRTLAIHTVASLAAFDPYLAEALSFEKLNHLFSPKPVLEEFARKRGWDSLHGPELANWENGVSHRVAGASRIHSAFLSLNDSKQHLKKRLWSAQLKVLFPYTEEQRRRLLDDYRNFLHVPHITPDEKQIDDVLDLELAHILAQFRSGRGIDNREIEKTDKLRRIRNALSHLELVDLGLIPE